MPPRKTKQQAKPPGGSDDVIARLDLIAGLLALPPDAKDAQKLAVASRIGLKAADIAGIFGKSVGATQKAIQRAKKNG
jgi:DNA-directed RNA polymerase specialized sigma24 family protein